MIHRTRGLLLLGTTALCAAALVPANIGENPSNGFSRAVRRTETTIGKAAAAVGSAVYGSLRPGVKPQDGDPTDPTLQAANLRDARSEEAGGLNPIGPVLDLPQAAQDGSALRQAYLVAAADGKLRDLGYDPAGIEDAIAAYRADNVGGGDAIAAGITNPVVRTALEWLALRDAPAKIGLNRLEAFRAAHPEWPTKSWFRHQSEARLLHVSDPKVVERFFATAQPTTTLGKLALAKALKADNRPAEAAELARAVFRDSDLSAPLEGRLKADFGAELTRGDYKYRADRLVYKEQFGPALHYAAQAGADVLALEKARAAVILDAPSDKMIAAVPEALRRDPGLILAEVQKLRREDKLMEAATLMQSAPKDPVQLIDGDDWWTERRVLARRLLDNGNINAAYVICATHAAATGEAKIEAEFHAGWIALRFMNEPARAAYHFAQAAKIVETPTSVARIAYWQGRTAEASSEADATERARTFYQKAAGYGATFYGQIARNLLGITATPVSEPPVEAIGPARDEAVRAIELLYAAGERDAANALAVDAASALTDGRQVRALASVVRATGDAHVALTVGKMLGQRGIAVDTLAFPTFGIPHYEALQNSAARPVVYAIARQESAFMPAVVSKAGAKGLMQIIDATARRTATKAGVPFDASRLTTDPAFNAQLGAAHLGELMSEQGGSLILTFAAYNAGGGRVKQWIEAYGDPRSPAVDPVDWIERIPFTETRNYVQRVMANVTMYEAIFADQAKAVAANGTPDRQAKL